MLDVISIELIQKMKLLNVWVYIVVIYFYDTMLLLFVLAFFYMQYISTAYGRTHHSMMWRYAAEYIPCRANSFNASFSSSARPRQTCSMHRVLERARCTSAAARDVPPAAAVWSGYLNVTQPSDGLNRSSLLFLAGGAGLKYGECTVEVPWYRGCIS